AGPFGAAAGLRLVPSRFAGERCGRAGRTARIRPGGGRRHGHVSAHGARRVDRTVRARRLNVSCEIDRKFLVAGDAWRSAVARSQRLVQGYLMPSGTGACSVRVRIGGDLAWLNIKSAIAGVERAEYEYPIPRADAEQMLQRFCTGAIEKIRHHVPHAGRTFEVDEFGGENAG